MKLSLLRLTLEICSVHPNKFENCGYSIKVVEFSGKFRIYGRSSKQWFWRLLTYNNCYEFSEIHVYSIAESTYKKFTNLPHHQYKTKVRLLAYDKFVKDSTTELIVKMTNPVEFSDHISPGLYSEYSNLENSLNSSSKFSATMSKSDR